MPLKRSESQNTQRTASDERRTQLRKAQQRSRQRKLEALNDAKQQAEELQAKLTRTSKIIAELLETADDATRIRLNSVQALIGTPSTSSSGGSRRVTQSPAPRQCLDSSNSNVSSDTYDDMVGARENIANSLHLDPIMETTVFGYTPELGSAVTPDEPAFTTSDLLFGDFSTLGADTQVYQGDVLLSQEATAFDGLFDSVSHDDMALIMTDTEASGMKSMPNSFGNPMPSLSMPTLSHFEGNFARRLYRRAWETVYDMLTLPANPTQLEAAFGNTFSYLTPSTILSLCVSILQADKFDPAEYFTRPIFQLPRRSMAQQQAMAPVQSPVPLRPYDGQGEARNIARRERVDDPFMTAMDVEKYLVEGGVLDLTTTEVGERITKPTVFELSGRRWMLNLESYIQGLLSVAVCVGRSPSFPSAEVSRILFQSMRPVYV